MSDLDNKAEAAAAFLNAGNLVRAKALCREVLEKQDDNWTAFQTLFRLRKRESDYDQAEAACYWRLERLPGCVHTKILLLEAQSLIGNKAKGKATYDSIVAQHGDWPYIVQKAGIMYHAVLGSKAQAKRLIKQAREDSRIDPIWLDYYESDINLDEANIFASYKMNKGHQADDPNSKWLMYEQALFSFLMGRLFSAIKYGKRLKTLSPDMRVEAKEIIIFSYLAMLPIFWLPHFIYVVYSCFLKRLPLVIQIAGIVVLYYYTATLLNRVSFHYLSENHISLYRLIIKSFPFVAIGWVFYLQLGFLRLFPHLSNRNKAVNIREDY